MSDFNIKLESWDDKLIQKMRRWAMPASRFAIFLVYFWFGILKALALSPASPLVLALLDRTMPGVDPVTFLVAFGILEMIIGIMFLIPHLERLAIFVMFLHLITTMMPLVLLPEYVWTGFLTPTLEGQYILKNVLLLALAIGILAHLRPLKEGVNKKEPLHN